MLKQPNLGSFPLMWAAGEVGGLFREGSAALSVQPEGQGRREPPEIAWGSDIFSRGGHDVKPCCRTRMDSHTPSGSYGFSRTSLCTESDTESETDPN